MKSFTVTEKESGMRLNRFLEKHVPKLGGGEMYRALRLKRIKLNRMRTEASARVEAGDIIDVYLNDSYFERDADYSFDFLRASSKITLSYEDENIAVVYKPAGVLVHADKTEYNDTLINRYLRYLYEKDEYVPDSGFVPQLCNRLDRGTAGLVLIAKNARALAEGTRIIKERDVYKYYLCITVKEPPADGIYSAYLRKNEKTNTVEITDSPVFGSKEIHTGIKLLKSGGGLWLTEVDLITGRPHQIRAHLKYLGSPILGDEKYGIPAINRRYDIRRQALCSYKLTFAEDLSAYPTLSYLSGKTITFDDIWFVSEFFK